MKVELLKRRPYESWMGEPAFGGTYVIYDLSGRIYYVGTSKRNVPGRLRHHVTEDGILANHVLTDRGASYGKWLVEELLSWPVATTTLSELDAIDILRPIHGHKRRQSFYYKVLRDVGTLLLGDGPPYGGLPRYIAELNATLCASNTGEEE